jgi:hypothetical protein
MYSYLLIFSICFFIYYYFNNKIYKNINKIKYKKHKKYKKYKKIEKFNISNSYPISNQINVKVNNFDNIIDNYNLKRINNILQEVRNIANYGNSPIKFNNMNLPVSQQNISINRIEPIVSYLINNINKIGNGFHTIKLLDIQNPMQYSTDIQSLITFRIVSQYTIKVNDSYNLKNTNPSYKHPKIKNDLVILFELISQKNNFEELFLDLNSIKTDKIYINKINLIDIDKGKYLPGNNLDEFNSYFKYTQILSNQIVQEKHLETKKKQNQNEVNNLTKSISNNNNTDITIESFFK